MAVWESRPFSSLVPGFEANFGGGGDILTLAPQPPGPFFPLRAALRLSPTSVIRAGYSAGLAVGQPGHLLSGVAVFYHPLARKTLARHLQGH